MSNSTASLERIVAAFERLQDEICAGLEALDGVAKFQQELWQRPEGGGGRTRAIAGGRVIAKGGVNFSHVHGPLPDKIAAALKLPAGQNFHATGVSIVIHADRPYVPIIHMNVRYFELSNGHHWFGGGIDVTPIYVEHGQALDFHRELKAICDRFNPEYYDAYKPWADRYFTLAHRKESRGIGGIFFDHLTARDGVQKAEFLDFCLAVGGFFVPAYSALVHANQERPFTQRERDWQSHRRARYVEFNLLWDKGTRFGIDTDGRTESILMSMPPVATWAYNYQPEPGSPEAETLRWLQPVDWLGSGLPIAETHPNHIVHA